MPGSYPREFREDVVAVTRRRESGVTIKQIAADFGISERPANWPRQADIEEGNHPGQTAEAGELKKRIRLLEQGVRRAATYLSQANPKLGGSPNDVPHIAELAYAGIPVTVSCRILKLARQPYCRWRNDPYGNDDVLRAYRINALHDPHHDDLTLPSTFTLVPARLSPNRQCCDVEWNHPVGYASEWSVADR